MLHTVILIRGFPTKLWVSKVAGIFCEFQDFHLGVLGQNAIWVLVPWSVTKYTIRGRWWPPPKSEPWWILWVHVYLWLVYAPKVFQLCINQLGIWFVLVWVIELLVNLFNPHLGAPTCPSTLEVLCTKERAQLLLLSLSSPLDLQWVHQRAWGCVTLGLFFRIVQILRKKNHFGGGGGSCLTNSLTMKIIFKLQAHTPKNSFIFSSFVRTYTI
jgi:hypothetical protein